MITTVVALMYFTIYKITNKLNNKTYIGKHQTSNIDDGYMGSGKLIKAAIKKYGMSNFEKEILFIFDNEIEMNNKEAILVTEGVCKSADTYNLCPGGDGGFGHINSESEMRKIKNQKARKTTDVHLKAKYGVNNAAQLPVSRKKLSDSMIKRHRNGMIPSPPCWVGRSHTMETRKRLSDAKKGTMMGESNPSYGTIWITNGIDNKKIKKTDPLPDGWKHGRVIK